MSTDTVARKTQVKSHVTWTSAAFIVESILLLLFLVTSLGILTKVFAESLNSSIESRALDAATIAATSVAESFTANPTAVAESTEAGDLTVKCEVTDEALADGTMYHAHIAVYDRTGARGGDAVYSVDTARYVSNAGGGTQGESGVA